MKKTNKEEKVYSIEELAKFIHESELMKKPPKEPLPKWAKIIISIVVILTIGFIYFKFIYKPYVFELSFESDLYKIAGSSFITKEGGVVLFDSKTISCKEDVVNILPFKYGKDGNLEVVLMLSKYGNLYNYNLLENILYEYPIIENKIKDISVITIDNLESIEATFENGAKKIVGIKDILNYSRQDVNLMDEIIYSYNDYFVYLKDSNMYICDYSKIKHFDILKEKYVNEDSEYLPNYITNQEGAKSKFDSCRYVKLDDKNVYIYGITDVGKLSICNLNLQDYESIPVELKLKEIGFNRKLLSFSDEIIRLGVRVNVDIEGKTIDIILDKFAYGSLSNDLQLISYTTDVYNPTKYTITYGKDGNNKYKDKYYVLSEYDSESKQYDMICSFINPHNEFMIMNMNLSLGSENIKNETRKVKLKENESIDKIYYENGDIYITIKRIIESNYVVFENTTEIKYDNYLLEEYIKGVEYYE